MAEENARKNILLIVTDQQRRDTLGCYGAPTCRTPHIDGLAEGGVCFDAAYTPTSPCSPARAALFTGLYPHKNHVRVNDDILNPDVPNLATELGDAGYNLGYAGKWHVDGARVPSEYGFQGKDFPGYGYPPTDGLVEGLRYMQRGSRPPHYKEYLADRGLEPPRVLEAFYGDNPGKQQQEMYALQSGSVESSFEYMASEFAIDLMRQFKDDDRPFFLWTNFWGPHTPCFVPEPYYSMYDPADIPQEPSFTETWECKPRVQELYERYWGLSGGGWEGWREIVARYWGYVTMIDDLVGRMLDALRDLGLEEDTVVIFTTDHGDMMGAHRLIEKGPFTYEECYHLPMVVAHPDCEAPGSVCDDFVYLHDLYPTFLEMAGAPPPDLPDSQSILDNVLGREVSTGRDSIYTAFQSQIFPFPQRMIRTRTHKLVYNVSDIGELYDMVGDPWEMRNLIDMPETEAIQNELLDRMREHMVRLEDPILGRFDVIRPVY
ncbi:MAG: sulfatase-like hydrolase/transferase [Anaerolineales bacterium]